LGDFLLRFSDGPARRGGVGGDSAGRGDVQRRIADLDWDGPGNWGGGGRGSIFFQGDSARTVTPIFWRHQRHSDPSGVSAWADRIARTERGAVAAIQQSGNGHHWADRPERTVFLRVDFWRRRAAGHT